MLFGFLSYTKHKVQTIEKGNKGHEYDLWAREPAAEKDIPMHKVVSHAWFLSCPALSLNAPNAHRDTLDYESRPPVMLSLMPKWNPDA